MLREVIQFATNARLTFLSLSSKVDETQNVIKRHVRVMYMTTSLIIYSIHPTHEDDDWTLALSNCDRYECLESRYIP